MNFSLPSGCTNADIIQKFTEELGWRVESVPDQFRNNPLPRGRTVFGSAHAILNQITSQYENLDWAFRDGLLQFTTVEPVLHKLKPREQRIWKVIQQGVKGPIYCRELHNAKLRPPTAWLEAGCPSTYPEAYRQGDPWTKRIQDEKHRIQKRAELVDE